MPHPPFPNPDSTLLKRITDNAINVLRSGAMDAEGALPHTAVQMPWGAS
jgi:hypothetical protein